MPGPHQQQRRGAVGADREGHLRRVLERQRHERLEREPEEGPRGHDDGAVVRAVAQVKGRHRHREEHQVRLLEEDVPAGKERKVGKRVRAAASAWSESGRPPPEEGGREETGLGLRTLSSSP